MDQSDILRSLELAHHQSTLAALDAESAENAVEESFLSTPSPTENEVEVSKHFEATYGQRFELFPEIWMRNNGGYRLRIDYIGFDKSKQVSGAIGFELKHGVLKSGNFSQFSNAMAQCIDYSQSRIETQLTGHPEAYGWYPRFVFMHPAPFCIYEFRTLGSKNMRDIFAQGQMKLAAKYGVGGSYYDEVTRDWGLFIGGHIAHWMNSGPTQLMVKHAISGRKGAAR